MDQTDPAAAGTPDSPQLSTLIAGYRRFHAQAWQPRLERWRTLSDQQTPEVMVIACSDSRVDPAQIFDAAPGEMFVVRNVAAMVPPFETSPGHHGVSAALEFAVQVLKVREVVVLGHGRCGGCHAALSRELHGAPPGRGGFIADWIALLDPVRDAVIADHGADGPAAERAMELAAVRQSLTNLRTFPCIRDKEARGALRLRGAFFAIADGGLALLDEAEGRFIPVTTSAPD